MRRLSVPLDFYSFPFALKACAQLRWGFLARCLHCQVLKFGFLSDLYVMNSLTHGYLVSDLLTDAYRVFDESSQRDVVSYNVLIDGFVKSGDVVKARELFDLMPVKDSVSWNTIIAGCAKGEYCEDAIELFDFMVDLEIKPDNIALVSTLSACAQLGELEKGKKVHDYIESNAIKVDSFLSTGLVDLYSKCGCIDVALNIFELSLDKNLFTWNAMLVGLAMHGYGELLLEYFSRMIESGLKPDGISILGVLVGCSHGGLVDEARKLFDEMESVYGVPREPKHYGCMADLLGRAGLIKEVTEMIKDMPRGGDISAWSGLLGGCRIHGDVEIAEKAAKHLMELKPDDGGVYSILANVYANAERWEDVVNIRRSLSSNRVVKKSPGYSLIQLDGFVHGFIAGDSLHSESDKIYLVLNGIREQQCEVQLSAVLLVVVNPVKKETCSENAKKKWLGGCEIAHLNASRPRMVKGNQSYGKNGYIWGGIAEICILVDQKEEGNLLTLEQGLLLWTPGGMSIFLNLSADAELDNEVIHRIRAGEREIHILRNLTI
ncbi:unnamed protein product [Dovyalis caffra]|uniref:Pentatricopeptide repeat-containing protein n=1 Tax=Dovyalis caffra TaxID=77055 RepID=A0AAV1RK92_9ROSI|nr:unnamed protein product [Dovyalis caffra]